MGPSSSTTIVLLKRRPCEDIETQGESHVKTEAEMRVIHLQAKECQHCQPSPEVGRTARNRFSFKALRRNQLSQQLVFRILAARTVRE